MAPASARCPRLWPRPHPLPLARSASDGLLSHSHFVCPRVEKLIFREMKAHAHETRGKNTNSQRKEGFGSASVWRTFTQHRPPRPFSVHTCRVSPPSPPPSQLSPDEKCSAAVAVLWLQNEPHRHHCRHRRPHTVTVVQVVDLSFFFPHRRTLSFLVSSRFNIDCGGGGGKRGNDGGRGRWRMVLRCQFHPLPSLIPSRILVVLSSASVTVVLFFLLHSLPSLPSPPLSIRRAFLGRSWLGGFLFLCFSDA